MGDLDFTLALKWVGHAPYSISKAALAMVNAKYAVEYQDEGFTFLAIAPGLVSTGIEPRELESFVSPLHVHSRDVYHRISLAKPDSSLQQIVRVD